MRPANSESTPSGSALRVVGLTKCPEGGEPPDIKALTPSVINYEKWDHLASLFNDLLPEQTGIYNVARWGEDNVDCAVLSDAHGNPVAGAVVVRRKFGRDSGVAVIMGGPVCVRKGSDWNATLFCHAVEALSNEYCDKQNSRLIIMPSCAPGGYERRCVLLSNLGFRKGPIVSKRQRFLVNVDQSAENVFAGLDHQWRNNLQKSLNAGLKISFSDSCESFFKLFRSMAERRKSDNVAGIGALKRIMAQGSENVRPFVVIVSHMERPMAGGVIFICGDTAKYMFGASEDRAVNLRADYAMHWWVVQQLCLFPQVSWYDLGSGEDSGLLEFKKGFVGTTGQIIDLCPPFHKD